MNILKSLSITPLHNIQLKLAKLKVFLLSRERRGWGGACIAKKIYLSQLAIQQIDAFSKPGRKHTHTWGQNLISFSA
jgi:hypothetical protein